MTESFLHDVEQIAPSASTQPTAWHFRILLSVDNASSPLHAALSLDYSQTEALALSLTTCR